MKKTKSIVAIVAAVIIVVVLSACINNRIRFGIWNPFELPDRIECFDRGYYKSTAADVIVDNDDLLLIDSSDNKTGKKLYVKSQGGTYSNDPVPTVIYLKTGTDNYHSYALSGGP